MPDPRLLETYLRMTPEEAKRRQSDQLREWFEKQQEIRREKLGETLGLSDLFTFVKPGTAAATTFAEIANKLFSAPASQDYHQGVVPHVVKMARKEVRAAQLPSTTPRRDLVRSKLYEKYGPKKLGQNYNHEGPRSFFQSPSAADNYELLVDLLPKAGISLGHNRVFKYPKNDERIFVDIARRPNLQARRFNESLSTRYPEILDAYLASPGGKPFPRPSDLFQPDMQAAFDPATVKSASRMIAALRPEAAKIGGERVTGIRTGKRGSENYTEIPLPRLTETAAQKERSQLSRFLHEILNERAARPKTKTAGR